MKVDIKLNPSCKEPFVTITASELSPEIEQLAKSLSTGEKRLVGHTQRGFLVIDPPDVVRVYAQGQKVFAQTNNGEFLLKLRLYEAEDILGTRDFVRISHSEIINIKKVRAFETDFGGAVSAVFEDGAHSYISRRYLQKVKQLLGL